MMLVSVSPRPGAAVDALRGPVDLLAVPSGAVGALVADRRRAHAVRADRVATSGAAQRCLDVRVALARHRTGRGRRCGRRGRRHGRVHRPQCYGAPRDPCVSIRPARRLAGSAGDPLELGPDLADVEQRGPAIHDLAVGADQVQPRLRQVVVAVQPVGRCLVQHLLLLRVLVPDLDMDVVGVASGPLAELLERVGASGRRTGWCSTRASRTARARRDRP